VRGSGGIGGSCVRIREGFRLWNILKLYKNQRAYLAIPVGDLKGLMILKNVLLCFKTSYHAVLVGPRSL